MRHKNGQRAAGDDETGVARRFAEKIGVPYFSVRKGRRGNNLSSDPLTAYNVDSIDKLVRAFEARERALTDKD